MLTEIAVFKPYVGVISPRTGDEAAFLFNVRGGGEAAVSRNEADLNVIGFFNLIHNS